MKSKLIFAGSVTSIMVLAGLTVFLSSKCTIGSEVTVVNATSNNTTVYVSFSADSYVLPANWASFCTNTTTLTCQFALAANGTQILPVFGNYLNATFSFDNPVGCDSTKAELNINNPNWYDITDVSLVDGYSNNIQIDVTDTTGKHVLGPPNGPTGNETVFGLFPLACDICTASQNPPCGSSPGGAGCKTGGQYDPTVPCQYQGPTMNGGSTIKVKLVPTTTADSGQ